MEKDVNCPYCDTPQDICHDDGYGYKEGVFYEQECGKCEKTFIYTTSISFYYDVEKAPCKNGGKHKWKQVHGAPKEHFIGVKRCEYCDKEKCFEPEARKKAVNEYFKKLSESAIPKPSS